MWSGTSLNPNLPNYDRMPRLSDKISLSFPKSTSTIDIFRLFLTPDITSYIADQSNFYRMQNNLFQQCPLTEDGFYSLIGYLYYSSVIPLPSKSDFWSNYYRQKIVTDSITRVRLLSILHLDDNMLEKDKGDKTEPLIRLFNQRCLSTVQPEMNISIDEQMVRYRGKTAPKVFK